MKNHKPNTAQGTLPGEGAGAGSALLIVGPVEEDGGCEPCFDDLPWPIHRVRSCLEFLIEVQSRHPCVVVCERDLADGNWKDVLDGAVSLPDPPPVIVTSRLADEYLWAEVLNLGGYDVLSKPLNKQEVSRVLSFAWEHWADRASQTERFQLGRERKGNRAECSAA